MDSISFLNNTHFILSDFCSYSLNVFAYFWFKKKNVSLSLSISWPLKLSLYISKTQRNNTFWFLLLIHIYIVSLYVCICLSYWTVQFSSELFNDGTFLHSFFFVCIRYSITSASDDLSQPKYLIEWCTCDFMIYNRKRSKLMMERQSIKQISIKKTRTNAVF